MKISLIKQNSYCIKNIKFGNNPQSKKLEDLKAKYNDALAEDKKIWQKVTAKGEEFKSTRDIMHNLRARIAEAKGLCINEENKIINDLKQKPTLIWGRADSMLHRCEIIREKQEEEKKRREIEESKAKFEERQTIRRILHGDRKDPKLYELDEPNCRGVRAEYYYLDSLDDLTDRVDAVVCILKKSPYFPEGLKYCLDNPNFKSDFQDFLRRGGVIDVDELYKGNLLPECDYEIIKTSEWIKSCEEREAHEKAGIEDSQRCLECDTQDYEPPYYPGDEISYAYWCELAKKFTYN